MPNWYLSESQLKGLKSYKYSGIDDSFLSRYILNPFWNRLVLLFPLWMAPNLITLIGLTFMIWGTLCVLSFPRSSLIYFNLAVCISTYLNMDALDGKQARRSGSSSPLGEFFDHGCDAINMMLMALITPYIFNLDLRDDGVLVLVMSLTGYLAFYASTWEEFHTGTLYLGYISGPVEGAWSLVLAALISSICGASLWDFKLTETFRIKDSVPIVFIIGSISTILTSALRVFRTKKSLKIIFKGFLIPTIYCASCWALIPKTRALNLEKWFFFFTGFPACFRITHTILAYITKSSLHPLRPHLLDLLPVPFLLLSPRLLNDSNWSLAFKAASLFSASIYFSIIIFIILDISHHLNIHCLTIPFKRNQ